MLIPKSQNKKWYNNLKNLDEYYKNEDDINRARQYGKTTTLAELKKYLSEQYNVLNLDFQRMSNETFRTEGSFVKAFASSLLEKAEFKGLSISDTDTLELRILFKAIIQTYTTIFRSGST